MGAIASPVLILVLLGYGRLGPNTGGAKLHGPFDGERAFADLKLLVNFGPRPSGSQALDRCRTFIISELHSAGLQVSEDAFTASTPIGQIPMTDIVATIPGTSSTVVIIAGHYDTKRMVTPFVGANDGGSSAAFLIELARELARRKQHLTYWIVFFDGEEALAHWSETDGLYGSRHFAKRLRETGAENRVMGVIVVDMIGDAHLDIQRETYSTPWLTDLVFTQARRLGYGRYFLKTGWRIEDDQLAFLRLGIPAVDVIDLDYGPFNLYWHRRSDSLDKCSSVSLAIVGDTVLQTLEALANKAVWP